MSLLTVIHPPTLPRGTDADRTRPETLALADVALGRPSFSSGRQSASTGLLKKTFYARDPPASFYKTLAKL